MAVENQKYNDAVAALVSDSRPINWKKYIFLFTTNWYWFLIAIFIGLSITYFKSRYTLPNYRATAVLLIEEDEQNMDLLNEIRSVRRNRNQTVLANEVAKLRSFSLHKRTIDSLDWNFFWTGHGRIAMERPLYQNGPFTIDVDTSSEGWYVDRVFYLKDFKNNSTRLQDKQSIDTIIHFDKWYDIAGWKFRILRNNSPLNYASYSFIKYNPLTLASFYRSKLMITASEDDGSIITISSQGLVVRQEVDYLNSLCQNFINSGLERKRLIANNTLEFIEDQISIIQDSLGKTEKQLLAFRLNKNVVDLDKKGQQAYDELKNYYEQKSQLKLKRNYYNYIKEYIQENKDPETIISPILIDAKDKTLIDQVEYLQSLYVQKELLGFSTAPGNPELDQVNQRIDSAKKKLIDIINGLLQNNKLTLDQITSEENLIEQQLLHLPISEQELLSINRKVEVNNQFYKFLLEKRAEAGIQRASTVSNIRILDHAMEYTAQQTGQSQSIIYLVAILLAILFPGGIILLNDLFDNRIKDRNDIDENTNLPILGVISHDPTGDNFPVNTTPGSAFAESFRHIRTNLQYIFREPDQKIIMISSTTAGEGKTFLANNLATILALGGKKILLGGFDLRRPSLQKLFNVTSDVGISTYLSGNCSIEEIIFPTKINHLDVMIAGPIPPNPAELLETKAMQSLIDVTTKKYDYIIIDTPPVALVTDALLISRYSHANIFVIRQNYSPKSVFELINSFEKRDMRNLSLVINDIKESKVFGYRYYYGYGYGYNYNYQYKYGYNYYTKNND